MALNLDNAAAASGLTDALLAAIERLGMRHRRCDRNRCKQHHAAGVKGMGEKLARHL
ncbi:hypothetical protein ACFODQ_02885 [Comamonas sp. JC664]